MKTKLRILMFLMLFFCLTIPSVSIQAEEILDAPVITNDLPSTSYLKKEKRSIASSQESSALANPEHGFLSATEKWRDPFLPGHYEVSNAGNVGAPVGDVSWPIILSILIFYIIYKGATTSKRRNNL